MKGPLSGKRVAVAGFNARPLACSLKRAGAEVYVSDYWGDEDLSSCCEEWISVLNPRPNQRHRAELETPVHLSLAENLVENFDCSEMDHIVVGSSFDDHTDSLRLIEEESILTGNRSDLFMRARNPTIVAEYARRAGLMFPEKELVGSLSAALEAAAELGYPCLIRPVVSGGGSGIRLMRSSADIECYVKRLEDSDEEWQKVIEQYIPGIDLSCSVLGTGAEAITLSLQGQLIGHPSAGRNCDFVYCGNYLPAQLDAKDTAHLKSACAQICKDLELVGSNGMDLVKGPDGGLWLMEVNPRIQGTLELLETTSKTSVSYMHIMASEGSLPAKMPQFRSGVKMIVYARASGKVPNLLRWAGTHDRSPEGVTVERGDPVCTIVESGSDLANCYGRVRSRAVAIQAAIR
ncbi:ATP-grasp domain-containing protein [Candidatus Thorarchaeota archaeon]|nr:MAG: ATP-grasp domain-containing protein [Candidatus Thorarchaeota archaeon]